MIHYVLKQETSRERWWTSELLVAADLRAVRQAVIAGFLSGQARWAERSDGSFIYGLNAQGREVTK